MTHDKLTIYCDGGSRGNPGPSAYGFVVVDGAAEIYKEKKFIGNTTNNVAEYQGLIHALEWLEKYQRKNKVKQVTIILDSLLVVKQVNKEYKVKSKNLAGLFAQAFRLLGSLGDTKVKVRHVKREENFTADGLVNEALDQQLM